MTQYLISFDDGAMTFPEEEMPDVAKAAHEVVQEATDARARVLACTSGRVPVNWQPVGAARRSSGLTCSGNGHVLGSALPSPLPPGNGSAAPTT